jgi:small subunit ribosomal protein S13e
VVCPRCSEVCASPSGAGPRFQPPPPPLPSSGLAPELPEDLYCLIKKAVSVRKHLERNRGDKDSKFRLILVESRIHRLARYYRRVRQLAPNWKYESSTASALVA